MFEAAVLLAYRLKAIHVPELQSAFSFNLSLSTVRPWLLWHVCNTKWCLVKQVSPETHTFLIYFLLFLFNSSFPLNPCLFFYLYTKFQSNSRFPFLCICYLMLFHQWNDNDRPATIHDVPYFTRTRTRINFILLMAINGIPVFQVLSPGTHW